MKLRPWVKVALLFALGVYAVSKIFSVTGSEATDGEEYIVYAIVSMELNGEAHVKPINRTAHVEKVENTNQYHPLQIITIVMQDDEVVNHYPTEGNELEKVKKKFEFTIREYSKGIYQSIYE